MTEEHENAVEWLDGQSVATFTLHSGKLKSRIMNLAKKRPDAVQITAGPKENGGYLVAHVPVGWIKIREPNNVEVTDEQREEYRRRMRKLNAAKYDELGV